MMDETDGDIGARSKHAAVEKQGKLFDMTTQHSEKLLESGRLDSGLEEELYTSADLSGGFDPVDDLADRLDSIDIIGHYKQKQPLAGLTKTDDESRKVEQFNECFDSGIFSLDSAYGSIGGRSKATSEHSPYLSSLPEVQVPANESCVTPGKSDDTIYSPSSLVEKAYSQDEDGDTDLHLAVVIENQEATEALVSLAPSSEYLDIQNDSFQTALHLAACTNQANLAQILLDKSASTQLRDNCGNSALHLAAENGFVEVVNLLASKQHAGHGLLSTKNYKGFTCLHLCAMLGCTPAAEQLIAAGSDVNIQEASQGRTALYLAVENGRSTCAKFLAAHDDTDINLPNYHLDTPLDEAEKHGYINICDMLKKNGGMTKRQMVDEDYTEDDDCEEYDDIMIGGQRIIVL